MAMLGFLVFLFYLIYNYLNANGNAGSGRKYTYPSHNVTSHNVYNLNAIHPEDLRQLTENVVRSWSLT